MKTSPNPKELNTLVEDIYSLFDPKVGHEPNEQNLDDFCNNLKDLLKVRLSQRDGLGDAIRFSSLGKGDRQLWYDAQGFEKEELTAKTYFKFLYGDIIEQLILFLCKEAGHEVTNEQDEIEVNGVLGHIDAIIDGVVVDVKSASPYSYKKFKDGSLFENDPFGYIPQISGYSEVLTPGRGGAFLAFDKVHGDICILGVGASITKAFEPIKRIEYLQEMVQKPEPPERCYEDVEDGKSGNRKLGTNCGYCGHKARCWPNLRTFLYSNGPRFLTVVAKTPDVPEARGQVKVENEEGVT